MCQTLLFLHSGTYRVWDELQLEPIREIHWYESRGAPLTDADKTLFQGEACEQAYTLVRSLTDHDQAADAYRRRK
ncbi:hypothetical protein P3T18_001093 [Paraburkholderia sp. GAS199]